MVNGETVPLSRDDYHLSSSESWRSGATGGVYPIGWKLEVPRLGLSLEISTPVKNQELVLKAISYWEGLIDVHGTRGGKGVAGHGYMELTGYSQPLEALRAAENR